MRYIWTLIILTAMLSVACKNKTVSTTVVEANASSEITTEATDISSEAAETNVIKTVSVSMGTGENVKVDIINNNPVKRNTEVKEVKPIKTVKEAKPKGDVVTTNTKVETSTASERPTSKPVEIVKPTVKEATPTTVVTTKPTKTEVKPEKPVKPAPVVQSNGSPNHKPFTSLLSTFVSADGIVDYAGLKKKEGSLDSYISTLQSLSPKPSWSQDVELAYWINVYNAYTLKLILENYPVKSITDLHGGKPWDVKWIEIAGKTLSLNNIENDIIRPTFNEPRIHFAVNCAAKSCPPLANEAFTAKNLESLLESRTNSFVNNSQYNTLSKNEVTVSKIFDWYGKDFGNVATFLSKYANVSPAAKVSFNEYDWALNGK